MDGDFFDKLNEASAELNISSQKIFKDLIDLISHAAKCGYITGMLTEYQDHSPERWETFYYSLEDDEIEEFMKVKQKYKISISKLAFMAFVLFWKLLLLRYSEKLLKSKTKTNSYEECCQKFKIYEGKFKMRLEIQHLE